jgi:hypothetical protein
MRTEIEIMESLVDDDDGVPSGGLRGMRFEVSFDDIRHGHKTICVFVEFGCPNPADRPVETVILSQTVESTLFMILT